MVQIGSRVDVCAWCQRRQVVGEFWSCSPRFRMFVCAACLRRAADGIDQAATSRYDERFAEAGR